MMFRNCSRSAVLTPVRFESEVSLHKTATLYLPLSGVAYYHLTVCLSNVVHNTEVDKGDVSGKRNCERFIF